MSADDRRTGWVRAPHLAIGALLVILAAAPAVWAHTDPPTATQTGISQILGIFSDAACTTPIAPGAPVLECQTVWVQATLLWADGPLPNQAASFEGGDWNLFELDGAVANLIGSLGQPVPCIGDPPTSADDPNSAANNGRGLCAGAANRLPSECLEYTPTAADIADTFMTFEAVYGNIDPNAADTAFAHLGVNDLAGVADTLPLRVAVQACPTSECNTGCDPVNLECVPTEVSTACDDTDGDLCTLAGCELDPEDPTLGVCVQDHNFVSCVQDECNSGQCDPASGLCVPIEPSTACGDTDGDLCTTAGCELDPADSSVGVCVQDHVTVDCPVDECNLGCDPDTGSCTPAEASTVCTDTDAADGVCAGCELDPADSNLGVCVQDHLDPAVCVEVPTLGEVGLALFAVVLLLGSTLMLYRRRLDI